MKEHISNVEDSPHNLLWIWVVKIIWEISVQSYLPMKSWVLHLSKTNNQTKKMYIFMNSNAKQHPTMVQQTSNKVCWAVWRDAHMFWAEQCCNIIGCLLKWASLKLHVYKSVTFRLWTTACFRLNMLINTAVKMLAHDWMSIIKRIFQGDLNHCVMSADICSFYQSQLWGLRTEDGYLSLQMKDVSDNLFNFLLWIFLLKLKCIMHVTMILQYENHYEAITRQKWFHGS